MSETQAEQARQGPPQAQQGPEGEQRQAVRQQPDLGGMLGALLGGDGGPSAQTASLLVKLAPAALSMLSAHGGVHGLLEKLTQGGLGTQVSSWVSASAQNEPVSGQQLSDALGREHLDRLAAQAGVTSREAADGVASVLPAAVDRLTPGGSVPKGHQGFDTERVTHMAELFGGSR